MQMSGERSIPRWWRRKHMSKEMNITKERTTGKSGSERSGIPATDMRTCKGPEGGSRKGQCV